MGIALLTVFLFSLFDFLHKSTSYLARYNPSFEHLLKYYIYRLPAQFTQALPIAALLASVICMVLLNRSNEVTAMRAAGMGPWRVAAPLVVGGLILSLTSILVSEFVVPRYAVRMHYIQDVLIEGQSADQLSEGARWVRDGKRLINFRDYNPITESLTAVKIVTLGEGFRPASVVEARRGQYLAEQKSWYLNDVTRAEFRSNGDLGETRKEKNLTLKFPMEPGMLQKERRSPGEMSMRELGAVISHGRKTGAGTLEFLVDLHGKIAYPFAALIVSLLGLKFGYRSERSTETVMGVLIAFGIGISYWFVFSWTTALGKRGDFPPMISAWAANLLISLIIFGDYLRSRAAAK